LGRGGGLMLVQEFVEKFVELAGEPHIWWGVSG
jgi:hypothetical protein